MISLHSCCSRFWPCRVSSFWGNLVSADTALGDAVRTLPYIIPCGGDVGSGHSSIGPMQPIEMQSRALVGPVIPYCHKQYTKCRAAPRLDRLSPLAASARSRRNGQWSSSVRSIKYAARDSARRFASFPPPFLSFSFSLSSPSSLFLSSYPSVL